MSEIGCAQTHDPLHEECLRILNWDRKREKQGIVGIMERANDDGEPRGLSPFPIPPYIYPPGGRIDCFRYTFEDDRQTQIKICADKGLELYNKKHGTDYELVSYVDLNCYIIDGMWMHANFTAKPKDAPPVRENIKLFFAELERIICPIDFIATGCEMLDGAETKIGCNICPDMITHPTVGFKKGI